MKHRRRLAVLAALAVGTGLGFGLKSVLADGIPTPNPLYYSGTLTEGGMLVNDPARSIKVNLWTNSTPTAGESALCTTSVTTPVINGRFRVSLDGSCKGGINANPNVFVEVVENGTTLPRAKIGAVPYAVEADHAVNATSAAYAADAGHSASADNATNATNAGHASTADTVSGVVDNGSAGYVRIGTTQIAWGTATTPSGASGYVRATFPIAFLDGSYSITALAGQAGVTGGFAQGQPIDATQAILQFNGTSPDGRDLRWIAIGRWK